MQLRWVLLPLLAPPPLAATAENSAGSCSLFLATPQGGRHRDLILREDQLLAKAHRLRKKKEKAELDPFAPEYGEDTWHQVSNNATVCATAQRGTAWP